MPPVFAQQVASYQLTEDRAALALAWNAPANSVGADTVQRVQGSQGSMREGSVKKNLQKRKLNVHRHNTGSLLYPEEFRALFLQTTCQAYYNVYRDQGLRQALFRLIGTTQTPFFNDTDLDAGRAYGYQARHVENIAS